MNCVSISLLKCHPKNQEYYNGLTPEKYEEIKRSIEINGIRDPLKVLPDYTIIAGHQRFKIAQELELTQVPVVIMDIDQKEAEYILIADNCISFRICVYKFHHCFASFFILLCCQFR
jgi:ParB family chromosome partitioning protein